MELIVSIVLFLIIAVVVMLLFCFITKYFNKKLQRALEDENEVYSMIEQIRGQGENDEDAEGEYDEYMDKRENEKNDLGKKDQKFEIQMMDVKDPLGKYAEDIYGKGRLKRRLDGEGGVAPKGQETGRSLASMKSFRPEKLNSKRDTNRSTNRSQAEEMGEEEMVNSGEDSQRPIKGRRKKKNKSKKDDVTLHKYISKIVAYTEEGISILEKKLISVTKKGSEIEEKKVIKKSLVKDSQSSFDDTLEAYGFDKGTFCACKFVSTLEIPHMKQSEEYPLTALKRTESREEVQFAEFYSSKEELQIQS